MVVGTIFLENGFYYIVRYARACILYGNLHELVLLVDHSEFQTNFSLKRKFDCVTDEVDDDLLKSLPIGVDQQLSFREKVRVKNQLQVLLAGLILEQLFEVRN